jgi:UDP-GlcNAc:undecaprenyl-phosphate GlcNAc-1-phosphate transferase
MLNNAISNWPLVFQIIISIGTAAVVALLAFPGVRKLAVHWGAIDVPSDDRRMHTEPKPRLGGLSIYCGFLCSILLFSNFNSQMGSILLGSVIVVGVGVVDDIKRLSYLIKFPFQILAATIVVLNGVRIEAFGNPFHIWFGPQYLHLGVLAIPISIFWIVALTNAVNFIDGLDGLACGVSCIGSTAMLIVALLMGESDSFLVLCALSGACLGFLPFNFNPAKMFMGDSGATFLGFILAVVSVQGLFKMYAVVSFAVPFFILGLPILDIISSVFRRIFSGNNPALGDRKHIHHRLIDMGLSQKQVVSLLYALSILFGIFAVVLAEWSTSLPVVILLLTTTATILIAIRIVIGPKDKTKEKSDSDDKEQLP